MSVLFYKVLNENYCLLLPIFVVNKTNNFRKNRTATKTLSVWRYPDFLIIILKRFVYLERGPGGVSGSVKLDKRVQFPVNELDLNPYLSGWFYSTIFT